VSADGRGLVSQAGSVLLRETTCIKEAFGDLAEDDAEMDGDG
jgi:hypothetical protein